MKLAKEQIIKIQEALKTRVPAPGNCPICKSENATWEMGAGLVYFVIQDDPQNIKIAGRSLPCLPATCSNCGNIQFFNVLNLGLRELLEPQKKVDAGQEILKPQ